MLGVARTTIESSKISSVQFILGNAM